ncbi:hypothetical protein GPA22_15685, partial [Aromatoleum toluvorans]|nr:hypothetical protein [Aromatoleum toluvorans]
MEIGRLRIELQLVRPHGAREPCGLGAAKIVKEISDRLSFLINVGLDYLSLDRSADTLSG